MRKHFTLRQVTLAALTLAAAGAAQATNGYFSHGYGIKAKGMGGAAVAMAQDAFAGANNPAAAAFAGNRYEVGADIFMPVRSTEFPGFPGHPAQSGKEAFLVPEFGYNVGLSEKLGLGLSVYGNGGMNTSYPAALFNQGIDLIQLIVAPTIAYQVSPGHSLGISPLLVYQQFEAVNVLPTNPGSDSSTGFGIRIGYMGKINDVLTVGASYAPKINMSRFSKYSSLFLEGGDFDIPENYTVGVSASVTPDITVALDFQKIMYSKVASVGQPNSLGGFGWSDVNVLKLGVQWKASEQWTLRAGINVGDNPVGSEDLSFSYLAPGVTKSHVTFGGTYAIDKLSEISFSYMYAKESSVTGDVDFPTTLISPDVVNAIAKMKQSSIGIQYSRKF